MATSTYPARSPQLPLASFYRRIKAWDNVAFLVTLASAVLILAIVGLIVFELWISSQPTIKTFGWSFLMTFAVGSECREIRGSAFHLRHLRHFVFSLADLPCLSASWPRYSLRNSRLRGSPAFLRF